MEVRKAFTKISDLIHFGIGAVIKVAKILGFKWFSAVLIIIYILYQALQEEPRLDSYGDYIEMILGYIFVEVIM